MDWELQLRAANNRLDGTRTSQEPPAAANPRLKRNADHMDELRKRRSRYSRAYSLWCNVAPSEVLTIRDSIARHNQIARLGRTARPFGSSLIRCLER